MSDEEPLSDIDRRSLRILARSSKSSTSGERLSARLERAAETGSRQDYEKAEQTFDSLPPEDRQKIGAKAEKQAETERDLVVSRKRRAARPAAAPPPPPSDDALEWKPIFAPASDEAPAPPAKKPKAKPQTVETENEAGMSWKLGNIPGNPKMPKTGRAEQPAEKRPIKPIPEDWDPEDDEKPWDWRKIPDDPVLNGGSKKKDGAVDPIEELRRQMLGLDAKYGKN